MKIVTWNVNGLRAALRKGIWEWVQSESPDVLCLQEVKAKPEQLADDQQSMIREVFPHVYWNSAERLGYSGTITCSKVDANEVKYGTGDREFGGEGRVVQTSFPDFILFNVYFPNGGRDLGRLNFKLDFYDHFLSLCDDLHQRGENIVICGDFNTAHKEIDLRNPKQNQTTSGFLPEERVWIDRYLEYGFVDVYRKNYPDKEQYTWWTYRFSARSRNIGWRLDYFLVSESLVEKITDIRIHDEVLGSDHCPVSIEILHQRINRVHP